MDLALFFQNKRVFWLWIFVPILIHAGCMAGLAFADHNSKEALVVEQALIAAVPELERAAEAARTQLKDFTPFTGLSSQEMFLTDFSKLLYDTDIKGNTTVDEAESRKGSGIRVYTFGVDGTAPGLAEFSRLLDKASRMEYLRLFSCELYRDKQRETVSYEFALQFERTEVLPEGGR